MDGNVGNVVARIWYGALLLLAMGQAAAEPMRVAYPDVQAVSDRYFIGLLRMALDKSGEAYTMRAWAVPLTRGRGIAEVARGEHLDVIWAVTSRKREHGMLPVRIPLDKGLSGWRIPIVRQGERDLFRQVRTPADMKSLAAGHGFDWAGIDIFHANGFPVVTGSPDLPSLLKMLSVGRFDYLLRSPAELLVEQKQLADMAVELVNPDMPPQALERNPQLFLRVADFRKAGASPASSRARR